MTKYDQQRPAVRIGVANAKIPSLKLSDYNKTTWSSSSLQFLSALPETIMEAEWTFFQVTGAQWP